MNFWNRIALFTLVLSTVALTACTAGDGFMVNLRIVDATAGYTAISADREQNPTAITYAQQSTDSTAYITMDGTGKFEDVHSNEETRSTDVIGKEIKGFSKVTVQLKDEKIFITTDFLALIPVGSGTVRVEEKQTNETTAGIAEWNSILAGRTVAVQLTEEAAKQVAASATKLIQKTITKGLEVEFKRQMNKDVSVDATVQNLETSGATFMVNRTGLQTSTQEVKALMEVSINGL